MPRTLADQFELTETEQKMFVLLQDGLPHRRDEVLGCLREKYQTDEDGNKQYNTIQSHLMRIRKKLRVRGMSVICELKSRQIHYRMIRLIGSAVNGD